MTAGCLRRRVTASLDAVRAGKRDAWLALFDENAVLEDPVGRSPFDPTGNGHRGRAAITRFWDQVISRNKRFEYEIAQSHVCGAEVASVARFTITTMENHAWELDLVILHRFNSTGLIDSIRGFWEFPS